MPRRPRSLLAWVLPSLLVLAGFSSGCAHRHETVAAPMYEPTVVETTVEIPGQQVYLADNGYQSAGVAEVTGGPAPVDDYAVIQGSYDAVNADNADYVGYETLSSGQQVDVVVYVHTYQQPIESYPRVYWSNRYYYNVGGTLVFYSPHYGRWCYYWGPPVGLVYAWNYYYPARPYAWGNGYYGAGWYWGGVSHQGYHAYAPRDVMPPHRGGPSGRPSAHPGGPSGRPAHPGGARPQPGPQPASNTIHAGRGKPPVAPPAERPIGRVPSQPSGERPLHAGAGKRPVDPPARPGRPVDAGNGRGEPPQGPPGRPVHAGNGRGEPPQGRPGRPVHAGNGRGEPPQSPERPQRVGRPSGGTVHAGRVQAPAARPTRPASQPVPEWGNRRAVSSRPTPPRSAGSAPNWGNAPARSSRPSAAQPQRSAGPSSRPTPRPAASRPMGSSSRGAAPRPTPSRASSPMRSSRPASRPAPSRAAPSRAPSRASSPRPSASRPSGSRGPSRGRR